jgi:hypothetical protein
MNSSMIGKIEKAHRYAREPRRVRFTTLGATFHGEHDDYQITMADGHWDCSCHTFVSHVVGTCSHVMAMQQLLSEMLTEEARFASDSEARAEPALSAR